MSALFDYLRLAVATGVVLLPGALVTRALGRRSWAESVAWALAALSLGLALAFAFSAPIELALGVHLAVGLVALPFALRHRAEPRSSGRGPAVAAGIAFGIALWFVSGHPAGDGLFHLARVRKLLAFDDLSLRAVTEFADGGLHPGYAFPLWHGFLAAVAWVAHADPSLVVRHEASILAPIAVVVLYEAGLALFRSAWAAGAVVLGQLSLSSFASANGGAFASLALPATAGRLLLVPAALALVFERRYAAAAAIGLALTLAHPTYTIFVALALLGFVAVRALVDRDEALQLGGALGALLVPSGAVILWLLPTVRETASYRPGAEELDRAIAQYRDQLQVVSDTAYRLAPEVLARSGSVAVAALFLVPLAALAFRRRWAAFVLGGSAAVLVVMLVPDLFTRLSDAVSLSQSRRAAGFLPFAFAFAGGLAVVARLTGPLAPAIGLAAGIALQIATPGSFGRDLGEGTGPEWLAWYALIGAIVAIAAGAILRPGFDRRGPLAGLAALLFVLPVMANGAGDWSTAEHRRVQALTPGLIEALREDVPQGAVVFSDLETSYRIGAYAPLYVAANPPAHVADTERNRPYARRRDVLRFLRSADLEIPRRYGAQFVVVDTARFELDLDLPVVYRDERYTLYRPRSAPADGQSAKPTGIIVSWLDSRRTDLRPSRSDLLERERARILGFLAQRGAREVHVFGSVARGEDAGRSDIDLLIELPDGASAGGKLLTVLGLSEELSELLGVRVDVTTARTLRPEGSGACARRSGAPVSRQEELRLRDLLQAIEAIRDHVAGAGSIGRRAMQSSTTSS